MDPHRTFEHIRVEELDDGVFVALPTESGQAGANAGIIDLGDRTLVVDTLLTPVAAHELFAAAQQVSGRRAGLVVNTHYHSDHTWGNQVCGDDVEIIASAGTRALLLEAGLEEAAWYRQTAPAEIDRIDAQLAALAQEDGRAANRRSRLEAGRRFYQAALAALDDLELRPPTLTFQQQLTLHGSRRSVHLYCLGGGHTRSDSVVHVPDAEILFTGDLVTVAAHPYLPDGDPTAWDEILGRLQAIQPRQVVPGHGPVGRAHALADVRSYLRALKEISAALVNGKDSSLNLDQFVAQARIPRAFADWEFAAFFSQNLRFLVARMSKVVS